MTKTNTNINAKTKTKTRGRKEHKCAKQKLFLRFLHLPIGGQLVSRVRVKVRVRVRVGVRVRAKVKVNGKERGAVYYDL
jgi:hypothetical protein